jgi:hypothetical protein
VMEKHIARASKLERIENEYARREGVPPETLSIVHRTWVQRRCAIL